jgi:polysaccharide export outer membrane protein
MKNRFTLILIALLAILGSSCSTWHQVAYFQDLDRTSAIQEDIRNYTPLTIQTGDILNIAVTTVTPNNLFNSNTNNTNVVINDNSQAANSTNAASGFTVDQKGTIQVPYIGTIKVLGLTTADIRDQLSKSLATYVKDPIVNVHILNFKVSVMGDVFKPGVYSFPSERVTIPEALGISGDLNITAKRTNVLLIREKDGKREFVPIDLTSKKLFESPYYYLKNNDVIYVDPDRTKYAPVDRGYRTVSLLLTAFGAVAIIASAFLIQHNK